MPSAHHRDMTDTVFDRGAVRRHRDRAAATVTRVAPVLEEVADRLLDRLDDVTRTFTRALDLGGRGVVAPLPDPAGASTPSAVSCLRRWPGSMAPWWAMPEWLPVRPGQLRPRGRQPLAASWSTTCPAHSSSCARRCGRTACCWRACRCSAPSPSFEAPSASAEAESALTGGASPRVAPLAGLPDCAVPAATGRISVSCRWSTPTLITLLYADPLALLHELRAAGEASADMRCAPAGIPPRALFPMPHSRALPTQDGRDGCDASAGDDDRLGARAEPAPPGGTRQRSCKFSGCPPRALTWAHTLAYET